MSAPGVIEELNAALGDNAVEWNVPGFGVDVLYALELEGDTEQVRLALDAPALQTSERAITIDA